MQELNLFIKEYYYLFEVIKTVAIVLLALLIFKKTGSIKYIEEVFNLIFRTFGYNVTETPNENGELQRSQKVSSAQSFNELVPIYRLNKVTNELEKTGEFIDIKEQIQSFKDEALQNMLDRFMPKLVDDTADYTNVKGDLDLLTETFSIAEEYREKLGLSEQLTIQEVYAHMDNYAKDLKTKLEEKEVKNEKENV